MRNQGCGIRYRKTQCIARHIRVLATARRPTQASSRPGPSRQSGPDRLPANHRCINAAGGLKAAEAGARMAAVKTAARVAAMGEATVAAEARAAATAIATS